MVINKEMQTYLMKEDLKLQKNEGKQRILSLKVLSKQIKPFIIQK